MATFAPVGILRAAAWSIDGLNPFGDAELARTAAQATSTNWQTYVTAYNRVLDREREALWQLTAGDCRFMKALRLSNPIVAQKINALGNLSQQPRSKAIRRLENTVYRYLARAIGRTTPNGLWAGVSSIQFGDETTQTTIAAQYAFSPDLRPFQTLLRSIARQPAYRETAQWQVNPTLAQLNQTTWHFWQRTETGRVEQRALESDETLNQLLIELIHLQRGTIEELITGLHKVGLEVVELRSLLNIFIDNGLLLGGIDLPDHFDTPWSALELAAQGLRASHQTIWNQAIDQLKHICSTLETTIEAMSLNEFEQSLTQATICVIKLAGAFDVELQLPDPLLHCDLTVPFQVSLDSTHQAMLTETLTSYERCWIDHISPATALRQQQREQLSRQLENDVAISNLPNPVQSWTNGLTQPSGEMGVETKTRIETWSKLLAQPQSQVVLEPGTTPPIAKAPFGCLYVSPFASFQVMVRGIDDDPARAFARFWGCQDTNTRLSTWFEQQLGQLAQQCHITIAQLQSPFEANPNVLARPNFGIPYLNLWSANLDGISLSGATVGLDSISGLPCLQLPNLLQPVVVFWFSAANIGATDSIAATLLYTSFQERPISIPASTVPVAMELAAPRFTPRVCLPEGAMIRPRRTVLSGTPLQELAQLSPLERYTQWQHLAIAHKWNDLLMLQIDAEPPLLIRRDSPLALEALFKSVRAETQWLIVEEVVDLPWLTDADGRHYFSELAFPFQRSGHGWSRRSHLSSSTCEI